MITDLIRVLWRIGVAWPDLSRDTTSLFRSLFMKNQAYLMKLCRYLPIQGDYSRTPDSYVYSSELDGRAYQVIYHCAVKEKNKHELEIRVPVHQKFWLRLLPQISESEIHDELRLIDHELDSRFVIHTDQPEIVKVFLMTPFIRGELLRLPRFNRFEVYRGWLKVVFVGPQSAGITISKFEATVNFLVHLAGFYEAQTLAVKIVPVVHVKSFCPYCREKIRESDKEVFNCVRCGASMHLECWKDNSLQCTTWGCSLAS